MALEKEWEAYKHKFSEIAQYEGKFALFQSENLIGIYDTYNDALRSGYEHCGLHVSFMVKEILAAEEPYLQSSVLEPEMEHRVS